MSRKRESWQKATGVMYLLHKDNPMHPHTARWKLETGRLPLKEETQLMKDFNSHTIRDTYRDFHRGEETVESFRNEKLEDMERKGWVTKSDYHIAKRLKKYL